jgi:hypothetical protein
VQPSEVARNGSVLPILLIDLLLYSFAGRNEIRPAFPGGDDAKALAIFGEPSEEAQEALTGLNPTYLGFLGRFWPAEPYGAGEGLERCPLCRTRHA